MFQRSLMVCQLLLAVIYSSAGISKFLHWFPNIIGPVWLVDELAKYGLGLLGYLVAVAQLITGIVLFFPQFRLIGAILLLPMQLCITVITFSLGWSGTPYVNVVLLLMVVALIYDGRHKLVSLIGDTHLFRQHKALYWGVFILFWGFTLLLKYGTAVSAGLVGE